MFPHMWPFQSTTRLFLCASSRNQTLYPYYDVTESSRLRNRSCTRLDPQEDVLEEILALVQSWPSHHCWHCRLWNQHHFNAGTFEQTVQIEPWKYYQDHRSLEYVLLYLSDVSQTSSLQMLTYQWCYIHLVWTVEVIDSSRSLYVLQRLLKVFI